MAATKVGNMITLDTVADKLSDIYPNANTTVTVRKMILSCTSAGSVIFDTDADVLMATIPLAAGSTVIDGPLSFPLGLKVDALPTGGTVLLIV